METIVKSPKDLGILFIASEADPLVKAGGLGDVAGSLPAAIHNLRNEDPNLNIDIRLAIPFYEHIREKVIDPTLVSSFDIKTLTGRVKAQIYATVLSGVTTYLVSGHPISCTDGIYGSDFSADAEKFVFFSLACLQIPIALKWNCAILHANDWHTAVAVHQLHQQRNANPHLKATRSILGIHNLPFMGTGSEKALNEYCIKPAQDKNLPPWGKTLPLPMGLAAANRIIAVSPTYAREILTPEFGCDLQDFLITRENHLTGILNGIDMVAWNPATDPNIAANFDAKTLEHRLKNKTALEAEFGFTHEPDTPLFVLISRMDRQKGVDIALAGLRKVKDLPWRVILLGTGDKSLELACRDLEEELPLKVRAAILFDTRLSRRMYAGADVLLMPSRYEPCGLSQMFAMRYGCLPFARATGGLVDTVLDPDSSQNPTGFLFANAEASSFASGFMRVLDFYAEKKVWKKMQLNGMSQDFSWTNSARKYIAHYAQLHGINNLGGKHELVP